MYNTTGKTSFQDKLKLGAKKNSISINEAYFENEENDNPGRLFKKAGRRAV